MEVFYVVNGNEDGGWRMKVEGESKEEGRRLILKSNHYS
jgi:hypothetical protein